MTKTADMNPTELRKIFIEKAAPLMEHYIDAALGKSNLPGTSDVASSEVWDLLKQIILITDDPTAIKCRSKSTEKKVDSILSQVARGELTPLQAKKQMELIALGQEIIELPKFIEALEENSE